MIWSEIIGTAIGGFAGYLYYKKIGCPSGACPITSNRYLSILYGAALGYMIGASF
ncbi:DUF6132 family protein [Lacrimispora sp. 38-1]|uniref:DUF6132 family protein n=1 Tax=Lacrimispora sp. 38-1 TaxID=3125778 RepID=UPI003CE8D41F